MNIPNHHPHHHPHHHPSTRLLSIPFASSVFSSPASTSSSYVVRRHHHSHHPHHSNWTVSSSSSSSSSSSTRRQVHPSMRSVVASSRYYISSFVRAYRVFVDRNRNQSIVQTMKTRASLVRCLYDDDDDDDDVDASRCCSSSSGDDGTTTRVSSIGVRRW